MAAFYFACMLKLCQFCGAPSTLVHVHGHYQCSNCGTNALPCCDGDNCDTNLQLAVITEKTGDNGSEFLAVKFNS